MNLTWLFTTAAVETINALPATILLIAVAAIALRLFPGLNASTRYAAWWMCLLGVLLLPILRRAAPGDGGSQPTQAPQAVLVGPVSRAATEFEVAAVELSADQELNLSVPPVQLSSGTFVPLAIAVWLSGVLFSLLRLARSYVWIRRRRASGHPLADAAFVQRCLERCSMKRRVRLLWSDAVRVPVATGFLRPAILLPSHLALHLDEAEIEDVVTHELAHIARCDDWMQLADRLLGALVWFHPPARWVLSRIRAERELCCDEWVIRSGASAREYAASLVKLAEFRRRDPALALAATSSKSEMSRRIEALLRTRRHAHVGISPIRLLLAGVALAVLIAGMASMPGVLSAVPYPEDGWVAAMPAQPPAPPAAQLPPEPPRTTAAMHPPAPRSINVLPSAPFPPAAELPPVPGHLPADAPAPAGPPAPAAALPGLDPLPPAQTMPGPLPSPPPVLVAQNRPQPAQPAQPRQPAIPARPNSLLAALKATGYGDLPVEEIIDLNNNGVKSDYLLELHEAGIGKLSTAELIRLRQHGVSASYLREMRSAGIQGLTTEDIVNFRNNSVDPKLVTAIRALGFGPYTPKQIIDMNANGVRAEIFQALKDNGIHQIEARDVIEARNNGINGSHLREARQFGPNLTIRQIIKLKNAGVI